MKLLSLVSAPAAPLWAGFWERALAKLIDFFLIQACLLPLDWIFGTSFLLQSGTERESIVLLLFCFYSAFFESSKAQATWGKRAVGIVVGGVDGNRISFRRALLRAVLQFYLPFDCVLALFTERKQTLHDFVVKTVVTPSTRYLTESCR